MGDADIAIFESSQVRFAYPVNWLAESEDSEDGLSVSLQSQGVSFAIVGIYSAEREPAEVAEQTLEALRQEHPSLEAEELLDALDDEDVHMELSFLSMDVVAQCWMRSWRSQESTVLVLMQSVEREATQAHAVFQAICKSIELNQQ